jgi:hypothetical protein
MEQPPRIPENPGAPAGAPAPEDGPRQRRNLVIGIVVLLAVAALITLGAIALINANTVPAPPAVATGIAAASATREQADCGDGALLAASQHAQELGARYPVRTDGLAINVAAQAQCDASGGMTYDLFIRVPVADLADEAGLADALADALEPLTAADGEAVVVIFDRDDAQLRLPARMLADVLADRSDRAALNTWIGQAE